MAEGYTIKNRDEFERMEGSGDATWLLARKALDWSSFGFNIVEIGPGGQIPEHDHAEEGEDELYVILEGEGVIHADGEDHPAPVGTYACFGPGVSRSILNRSDAPVTALLVGVKPDGGYEPMSWG